ncbi:hypothetical protein FRC11_002158 [Ceratobasidium sp. 423]|nr:hypothetical protein FRC11_002158 [Ceratobasidium sp. 423]
MDAEGAHLIFAEGAAGLALAASALAEAAQALSEAAAALSTIGQETKSPSTVYQSFETTPEVPESQEVDDEKDQIQEIDDDASSVGANTGNNVHRRDTTPEVGSNGATQSYNPAPPLGDPVPATSQPQVQHNSIDGQKQP